MKSTNLLSIYRRLCNGLHFIYYRRWGQNHRMDTKSSSQLYLNAVRYLTLRYLWLFFWAQSKLFLYSICNWCLLCALYIVIDFYTLEGFFDLNLLFQGTCSLFERLSEGKYETFANKPTSLRFLNFQKRCSLNRPWICHCIHFSQESFQTDNVTWLFDGLNKTFLEKTFS